MDRLVRALLVCGLLSSACAQAATYSIEIDVRDVHVERLLFGIAVPEPIAGGHMIFAISGSKVPGNESCSEQRIWAFEGTSPVDGGTMLVRLGTLPAGMSEVFSLGTMKPSCTYDVDVNADGGGGAIRIKIERESDSGLLVATTLSREDER
jgi:hypothetical protein